MRGRLLGIVAALLTVFIAGLTLAFNLVLDSRLERDATELARARASSALQGLEVVDGRLTAPEAPDAGSFDRPVWVFRGRRAIERPRAPVAVQRVADRVARSPGHADASGTRLASVAVRSHARQLGAVVAGVSMRPYERSQELALLGSLGLAAILLATGLVASRWLLAAGMRPVVRMTAQAAEWSDRDLRRRFEMGPPRDDLSRLAATLDGLLDRVASSLRREQRLTAEISHELRTPLARLRARAQLAGREPDLGASQRGAWEGVVRETDGMARTLDVLLAAARADADPSAPCDALAPARSAVEECASLAAGRGVEVELEQPRRPVRVRTTPELVERALYPLLDNACRYADRAVTVSVARDNGSVVYRVADDGPGVGEDERERIFEPASRGSAAGAAGLSGTGLGLALGRRLARAAGGDVAVIPGPGGRFELRLPGA